LLKLRHVRGGHAVKATGISYENLAIPGNGTDECRFPAAVGLTALILQPYFAGGKYLM
jgi:hypothetical protein